jgi:hypothetical protein
MNAFTKLSSTADGMGFAAKRFLNNIIDSQLK